MSNHANHDFTNKGRKPLQLWKKAMMVVFALVLAACGDGEDSGDTPTGSIQVNVLSSSTDRVSGEDVLVELRLAAFVGSVPSPVVQLNGVDVSAAFGADPATTGRYVGRVHGLAQGANDLVATVSSVQAKLHLTAFPLSGPITSGPHQSPFICQTSEFPLPDGSTLGPATDADCNVSPRVDYLYLPVGGSALVPLPNTSQLPADIASTTTSTGVTMPFVVRLETRIVDRGVYQSTVLHDPTTETEPSALAPPRGWNHGLIATHGVGCSPGWYIQGVVQTGLDIAGIDTRLLSPARLGEGHALYGNTLMFGSGNCNPVLLAEVSAMSKEQFVKGYGLPAYTVGIGCSGGAYSATQAADRNPGLYDGVLVACNFVDGLSSSIAGSDARLLQHYFLVTAPTALNSGQRAAVTGYSGDAAMAAAALNANRVDPVPGRIDGPGYVSAVWSADVPMGLRYDPQSNPEGARPTVYDAAKNVLGVEPATGFALSPYDNTGVQYGLQALNNGAITVGQFLELNAGIGGLDHDANYVATRSQGDPDALRRAYQSGLVLQGGGGLASIPVVDLTGIYDEGANYHQQWQHFAFRERLLHANGDLSNVLMWRGAPVDTNRALALFLGWVKADANDVAAGTQRERTIRNRPADAVEGCFSDSTFIPETLTLSSSADTPCNALLPSWGFPRLVAGGPLSADVLKCALKTPVTTDYAITLTPAEWQRLQTIFPQGVCDYGQAGIGQVPLVPDASFGPSPIDEIFTLF